MKFDELMDIYRNEDNFIIKESNKHSNNCFVFLSSHGLYKENGDIEVLKRMHDTNRYEWLSLFSNHKVAGCCKKAIFIRDIKKIFYLDGINNRLDSITKLAMFLKKETEGMNVYLIGSSAGGYAAYIISNYLQNVKRIYSLGGILDLNEHSTYLDYIKLKSNLGIKDVVDSINKESFVVHFCGSQNVESQKGIKLLRSCLSSKKCAIIPLKSTEHAPRPSGEDLIKLLTCSDKHLKRIKRKMRSKTEVGYFQFSIINLGIIKATINRIKKSIIRIIKNEK